jgi:hypothetical protein
VSSPWTFKDGANGGGPLDLSSRWNRSHQGETGPDLFRAACKFGLEGMVSKRRDRPHRAGRCNHWVKVKNRKHPAMSRVAIHSRESAATLANRPSQVEHPRPIPGEKQ